MADFSGRVVKVTDGDTVHVLDGQQTIKVRLLCIDSPERGQPYGNAAREHLAGMVAGKQVHVTSSGTDRYGRTLGKLYFDDSDTSANWRMVRDGYAWDYLRYSCGIDYANAERAAHDEGLGLWQEDDPVPPWEWRRK